MERMICRKCDREMELLESGIDYLGFHFTEKLPRCPTCGQVYISEKLVREKIKDIELTLEQK